MHHFQICTLMLCSVLMRASRRSKWRVVAVLSHNSYKNNNNKKTLAHAGQHAVDGGNKKQVWPGMDDEKLLGEKRVALNMWRAKKWTRERHNSVNPEEVKGASGRSVPFPPWQITQNTHNERQEYGSGSLFPSPNYQAPYWLSSGREEVILFLSPFGKLIHFTKVTW